MTPALGLLDALLTGGIPHCITYSTRDVWLDYVEPYPGKVISAFA